MVHGVVGVDVDTGLAGLEGNPDKADTALGVVGSHAVEVLVDMADLGNRTVFLVRLGKGELVNEWPQWGMGVLGQLDPACIVGFSDLAEVLVDLLTYLSMPAK